MDHSGDRCPSPQLAPALQAHNVPRQIALIFVADMILKSPEWLILIPLLATLAWFLPNLQLWRPLRALILILAVLILSEPQLRRLSKGMDLWVLVDRSASAEEMVVQNIDEWKQLLEQSKPTSNDRVFYVDFANGVIDSNDSDLNTEAGNLVNTLSRTNLAIHHTLAQIDNDRHSRLLLFSDGYSTEPIASSSDKLIEAEVPLDYRLLTPEDEIDARIANLNVPSRQKIGEPFLIDVAVVGTSIGPVPLTVFRNGQPIAKTNIDLFDGSGEVRFTDRLENTGSYLYEAIITPEEDAHDGNNRYQSWIEIAGGPSILLISKYLDDPIADILSKQGFHVELVTNARSLNTGRISGAEAIILNNVGAFEINDSFLEAIDFYVRNQGGGLLMCGGRNSFGSGGYFESAIDELLPVSLELKTEHRKLAVAMAVVMDRSGSMSMTVPGGLSKMQLANEGAARAVELLGDQDVITVFAVDSEAHSIVPPLEVGAHRHEITSRIRRIESMGGGIYVYNGLNAAWNELKNAELGQRHIILFSDAADSEQPGQYRSLLRSVTADGGSVSVIGLGDEGDPDAAFLKDIASLGNGRIFFTREAGNLPNIFAQETVSVARSTFVTDPTGTQPTGGWFELSADPLSWLETVDGYNLSYLRENATNALITTDSYAAPLVAFAQRGIGRSAAVSFPIGGDFSKAVYRWDKLGDFVQTLTRWLMGDEVPPGIGVRTEMVGTQLAIDLFYDDDWNDRFAEDPPRCLISSSNLKGNLDSLVWQRLSPSHFSTTRHLDPGETVRGVVQVGSHAIPFGPLVVGSSPEWAFDPSQIEKLREISIASGGRNLVDLGSAWLKPTRKDFLSIQNWLLSFLLFLALAEILLSRLGWRMPVINLTSFRRPHIQPHAKKSTPAASPPPKPTATKDTASPEEVDEHAYERSKDDPEESRSRFQRAKNRK
ncbi:MAG: VWA domain-containing protein [Verrucomicrobiota bacterium]